MMVPPSAPPVAQAVRAACIAAALEAFEDASIRGLCCEGAWECAVGAMTTLDLDEIVATLDDSEPPE